MRPLATRATKIAPSETLAINARAAELRAKGTDVISFAVGEPDFDTPQHIKEAAKAAIDANFTRYTAASGIPELKEAVCEKLKKDNNLIYSPKEVIVTCGGKHALYGAMQAILSPGDEVLLPTPYWVSFPEQIRLAGGVPTFVQTDANFQLTSREAKRRITERTRLIIVNSPCNPSGAVVKQKELAGIADLAVEHDLFVISDEVYEAFVYGQKHVSIASLGKEIRERTLTVNAVSKTYAMTGWRIGYCAGPSEIIRAMDGLQSHMTSNPTGIAQKAALAALKGDQGSVPQMVAAFDERRKYMVGRLNNIRGIRCVMPEGAFYAFPDISELFGGQVKGSAALCSYLLEQAHIAAVPGAAFGSENHIRLSYATSMELIEKGMDRLETAVDALGAQHRRPEIKKRSEGPSR